MLLKFIVWVVAGACIYVPVLVADHKVLFPFIFNQEPLSTEPAKVEPVEELNVTKLVPLSLNLISPPSASRFISDVASIVISSPLLIVNALLSDIVEPDKVISPTTILPPKVAEPSPFICAFTLSSLSLKVAIYLAEFASVACIFNP